MKVLGLTGGIASGKSLVSRFLRRMGAKVADADKLVHRLFLKPSIASQIGAIFPEALKSGKIDRAALGDAAFSNPFRLAVLESVIHPLVEAELKREIKKARVERRRLLVLEVPLLFESGLEKLCDATILVAAPRHIQKSRALRRPGMTEEKYSRIISRQMPLAEKRKRADFILTSGVDKRGLRNQAASLFWSHAEKTRNSSGR